MEKEKNIQHVIANFHFEGMDLTEDEIVRLKRIAAGEITVADAILEVKKELE